MRYKLQEIANVAAGQGAPQGDHNYCDYGMPFVKAGNLAELIAGADIGSIQKVNEEVAKKHRLKLFRKGSVLFAKSGMSCLKGFVYVLPSDAYVVSHLACVTPEKVNSKYLKYYFLFHKPNTLIKDEAYPSISLTDIANMVVQVPENNVVRNVVSTLEKVEFLLALYKSQLQKLDELVKSRFIEMFGDPETNPYRWEKTTVDDVCSSIVRGPFGSALKKEFFVERDNTTYKVYEQKHAIQKSATIGTYYVSEEKFNELRRFECLPGDIIMSCSGTMGELYQLPQGCEKGIINQALCKFTLNGKMLPIAFLTYMKETIGNLETKGSGIKNIAAVSYVKSMPINLPPMQVQHQFSAFVQEVDKSKFAVRQALDKTQQLFDSLMQEYFG
ncbi:MAG: restriction endonuclease subunit S [Akkermansiaceae bacterium]|nr:restriction endonuclease subunit S [Akkermansiaceae bacterium]